MVDGKNASLTLELLLYCHLHKLKNSIIYGVSKQKREFFLNLIDEFLNLLRDGLLLIDSYEISRKLFEVKILK